MKRILKYGWQFIIPIVLYFPFLFLYNAVFINWFGCSCPKIDENGNLLANQFNVNDFSMIFWTFIGLIVFIVSLIRSFKIVLNRKKALYIVLSAIISLVLAYLFFMATPRAK